MPRQSTKITVRCQRCDRTFVTVPSDILRGRRYCSTPCYLGDPLERFLSHVKKTDDCWLWTAAFSKSGYGKVALNGRDLRAHRASWELHFGAIPDGLCVLHRCDNPACVRPDHLWLGTYADNNKDRAAKGRSVSALKLDPSIAKRGEDLPQSKLTEAMVRIIRRLHFEENVAAIDICRRYGLAKSTVGHVLHRRTWGHVI